MIFIKYFYCLSNIYGNNLLIIYMSKFDKSYLKIHEICRPGRDFVFQIGIDRSRLDVLAQRVTEAFRRFQNMPLLPGLPMNWKKSC